MEEYSKLRDQLAARESKREREKPLVALVDGDEKRGNVSMGGKCEIDGQIGYRGQLEYSIERDRAGTKRREEVMFVPSKALEIVCEGGGHCVCAFSRHSGDRKFALSTLRCTIPARSSWLVRRGKI